MFRTKVCGITNLKDGLSAFEAGADAIGLNFYPPSPRSVSPSTALEIVNALPSSTLKVGVFVNAPLSDQTAIADHLQLDYIQLHGDEPPQHLAELSPRRAIRAFRFSTDNIQKILDYLGQCEELDCAPPAILVDACQPGSYGGTGKTVNWEQVRSLGDKLSDKRIILAGGLTPVNTSTAIFRARPWGVDVASGVESSPGRKDAALMREWVKVANRAFQELEQNQPD